MISWSITQAPVVRRVIDQEEWNPAAMKLVQCKATILWPILLNFTCVCVWLWLCASPDPGVQSLVLGGHEDAVWGLAFSAAHRRLVLGTNHHLDRGALRSQTAVYASLKRVKMNTITCFWLQRSFLFTVMATLYPLCFYTGCSKRGL
jgi:hypothetical protein